MRILFAAIALFATGAAPPRKPATPPVPTAPTVKVALTTAQGTIVLELKRSMAPVTVSNFLRYVDQRRFDGISCYRASKVPGRPDLGFLQCGTQNDPKRTLPKIAHEPTSQTGLKHTDGTISMARLAPGTAQGDWIITLGALPYLDADPTAAGDNAGNAAFGRVVEGIEVVRKIHAMPTGADARNPVMKGEMLSPPVKILTARRMP
jgi:peptidyl-prolyl cis-trans isomerase A (cyclophilin A)